jgi:TDG/mug DNA glycosylase family protein
MLGPARLWVLPNPSGLNAHFAPTALTQVFADLCSAVGVR